MKLRSLTLLLMIGAAAGYGCAPASKPAPDTAAVAPAVNLSRIQYDNQCFTIDGKDTFLYSGSFHYFRCPKPLWAARFQKMKEAGLNCVETYVAWNWHEQQPPSGLDDFSKMDMTDLTDWLDMAINQFGFYVILRPGPYICAEWDGGGYPQWLVTKRPANAGAHWLRGDDPVYLDWCKHWYTAAAKAVVPFQITHMPAGKPGVILWQIENEYDYAGQSPEIKLHQLQALAHDSRDLGIDVPLITCMTENNLFRQDQYLLKNVIECRNTYPRFDAANETRALGTLASYQPEKPRVVTELQGGWFSDVGGQLSQAIGLTPQQITRVTLVAWALGYTGTNYYMMFGGTNLGDWGSADRTTSYDYDAPIREPGGVGGRYFAVQAMANFLKEHSDQLVRAKAMEVTTDPSPQDVSVYLRIGKNGDRFLFLLNRQERDHARGTLRIVTKDAGIDGDVSYDLDPFDAKILYLPAGETDASRGQWYPKAVAPPRRPTNLPAAVNITSARRQIDPGPPLDSWQNLPAGASEENMGIYDRRYVYYRANLSATTQPDSVLSARLPGQDSFSAQFNDDPLQVSRHGRGTVIAPIPANAGTGQLLAVFENGGRANIGNELDDRCGLINATVGSAELLPRVLNSWSLKTVEGDPATQIGGDMDSTWRRTRITDRPNQLRGGQTGIFRAQFSLSAAEAAAGGRVLSFGTLTRDHTVYFNGRKLGETDSPRYDISGMMHEGSNDVAVVVIAGNRGGGIGGSAELDPATDAVSSLPWQISGESAGAVGRWWETNLDDSSWESVNLSDQVSPLGGAASLSWYRLHFELPAPDPHVWVPWKLHIRAVGNGFIYLNGHALGRFWEVGPQWDFFLPDCWLSTGPGSKNVVTLCMRQTAKGPPAIREASVQPYSEFAESR